ncbi:ABC transporter permease [Aquamicrobium defluvii]|uniref:Spermidine/putrescine ABC transporter permease n=1 Tax=Aquamicrobium defluvii TaxID=69279 RepID=A0A011SS67_9HYPH|nr:ABC transporter permease [Aquamicrobium defluvii]EXL01989.1 spermidine/putrescine ABC transporter permease [Aquamicrobium defluvii]EZQ13545.1 spermidine/putrescine ABC transporter permease [Halopseudomonas bauzanensis]
MSSNTTAAHGAVRPAPPPKYSTGIAKVVNSALYRYTLGAAVETRIGRLVLLAGVPLVWLLMLHVGPIYQMLKISLLSHYPVQPGMESHYTLANYAVFFSESLYFTPLVRSFIFAAVSTAITLVVVYPVAYYVAKIVRPEGRSKALLLLLVPFWAGELIRTFSVIMLLANRGAVNVLLREIGMIDRPIPLLYTPFSLGFGMIYLVCLYMLLPLYSAIEKIPSPLLDAAADLGAGPFTRFRRIILPLSRDGIVSGCCLVFLTCIGVFATPLLLGGPTTALFPETISSFFHGSSDKWPVGAAFSMLMLVTSLFTAALFMRIVGGSKRRAI